MTPQDTGVQQRLVHLRATIDQLEITEDHLELQLAEVRARKYGFRVEYAELTNSNAAIACLHDEVLAEIFRHLDGGWRDGLPLLVRASQVTRRWRTVALSVPSLWNIIELRPTSHSQRYQTELIKEYLARSGVGLLDIYIYMCENQDVGPVVDLLVPQINRWQRLVVESADEPAVQAFVRSLRNLSAPCLERLEIDLDIDEEQNQFLWRGESRTLGGGVPSLYYLGTRGINMQRWLPPLGGVKSVYIADCYSATLLSYSRFREILTALTSLTHLEVEGMVNCSEEDDVGLIEMPFLLSLCVLPPDYVNPVPYMRNIFTAISAPSLRTLCLRKVYGQQFRVFLETFRSASWHPVLETLILESVTGLEHLTPTFALSSPTITHLSLKFITNPKPILKLLTGHNLDPLWPRLQTLTVGPVDNGLLRSLMTARISAGRPLVKLRYATESPADFHRISANEMNWFSERLHVENVSYHDM